MVDSHRIAREISSASTPASISSNLSTSTINFCGFSQQQFTMWLSDSSSRLHHRGMARVELYKVGLTQRLCFGCWCLVLCCVMQGCALWFPLSPFSHPFFSFSFFPTSTSQNGASLGCSSMCPSPHNRDRPLCPEAR